ncbi:MAG: LPS assembly protein LptD [Acidobacteriota bacterium]
MSESRRRIIAAARIAVALVLGASLSGAAAAEQGPPSDPPPSPAPERQRKLVSEGAGGEALEIAAGPGSVIGKDELVLKEYVDIKYGDTRIQADFVRYVPSTKDVTALGNVILDQGTSRLTAEKLTFNLETETGTFYAARGYAEPSYYFEAERVEKISRDEMVLHEATFTACTQPVPYWSFRVSRGLIRENDYAYLRNLRFKIGRVVVFYSPYLVWPVKSDRASGLLFPEFGFSRRGGTIISNALYWAMRRNMDATFYLDYLSLAGYGTGLEYRYVPSASGRGYFTGYYIRDQVAKQEQKEGVPIDRWVINYGHNQEFLPGWRLVANANFISDFDYYRDFERDLRLSTNPQALSNLFVTRTWGFYTLNLRGERREQLINVPVGPLLGDSFTLTEEETITRWIKPKIELRGRRQRLGRLPLFMTLESSANFFDKGVAGASYARLDAFPVFSAQLSQLPWLDVDASVGYRDTYYSRSQISDVGCDGIPGTGDFGEGDGKDNSEHDENRDGLFDAGDDIGCDNDGLAVPPDFGEGNGIRDEERTLITDEAFNRHNYQAGLTLIGPRTSRVFDRPGSRFSPQYKHAFEPQIRYSYLSRVEDADRAIPFDEIDVVQANTNRITYALVTRLYAKRPVAGTADLGALLGPSNAAFVGGGGVDAYAQVRQALQRRKKEQAGATGAPAAETAEEEKKSLSTVEVATLEISQDYSLLGPLSSSTALGFPDEALTSPLSPVRATLRINPSIHASLHVRGAFDILFRQVREASLSANLRSTRRGFIDVTWSMVRDLEGKALLEKGLAFSQAFDRSQIGLQGETNFFGRRFLLGMQTNYELGDVLPGEPRLRDQRYRFGYNTQCCGFQLEVLNRNFLGTSQREFRFLINLKGVGNVVDFQSGSTGALPGTFPGIVP